MPTQPWPRNVAPCCAVDVAPLSTRSERRSAQPFVAVLAGNAPEVVCAGLSPIAGKLQMPPAAELL